MPIVARRDPTLSARVEARTSLVYGDGGDEAEDRLAFVRAGSGIAWLGDDLAVVQDDVSFIALVGTGGAVRAIALPRGKNGRRRFEERLGNKCGKLDLESCIAVTGPSGPELIAFGSGSLGPRRVIARIDPQSGRATLLRARKLFRNLRRAAGIAKRQLNIEGAVSSGDRVRFLHRGHRCGGPSAAIDVRYDDLVTWVAGGCRGKAPAVVAIARYDLGSEGGIPYGFTDGAALGDGRMLFLAAAEDTGDPIDDGAVLGLRLGVIDGQDVRFTELLDEHGRPTSIKAEGIAIDRADPSKLWLVTDADDVDRPAELFEVRVSGPSPHA